MNRRAFTLVELFIVIAIIAVIAAVLIPNLIAARQNQNVSTPVNAPSATPAGSLPTPERPSGYEVHTVDVPYTAGKLEATRIHETLVSWLREHLGHEIISIIRTDAGLLVIVTKNR